LIAFAILLADMSQRCLVVDSFNHEHRPHREGGSGHRGGSGGVSEVFLRGAESNFTAVFVDGVRLNNPANTRGDSFDFSKLGLGDTTALGARASAVDGGDEIEGMRQELTNLSARLPVSSAAVTAGR
jgi:outer membrane cobalamin receptor